MATKRGGKKRSDKKPGRQSAGHRSAYKFAKLASGQSNTSDGRWASISIVRLANKIEAEANSITERCTLNTARNSLSRSRQKQRYS